MLLICAIRCKHIQSLISVKLLMGPDGGIDGGKERLAQCLEDPDRLPAMLWFHI